VHGPLNTKRFDIKLGALPLGPTADTSASYTTIGTRALVNSDTSESWIFPFDCGTGLPREMTSYGFGAPTSKMTNS
jgi:hypothetical protein